MGARVSSSTQGTLLALQRTRCIAINVFLGWRGSLQYKELCIQWRLYEASRIWRLRVPLGIGRNLFCLTFPLWVLCAVNSPKFRPLYKAPWKDLSSTSASLGTLQEFQVFHFSWTKNATWIMGVVAEAKKVEAKDPSILQSDKKEHSLPSTRNRS